MKHLVIFSLVMAAIYNQTVYAESCGETLSPSEEYLVLDEYHVVHGDLYLCIEWEYGECVDFTYLGFGFFDPIFEVYLGGVPNDGSEDVIWECFDNGYYSGQMTFLQVEDTLSDGNYFLQPYNSSRTQEGLVVKVQSHVTGNLKVELTPWDDFWYEYNSNSCPSGWGCGDGMIRDMHSYDGGDYIKYPVCDTWDPCEDYERNTVTYTGEGDDHIIGSQCSDVIITADGADYIYDKHGWNNLSASDATSDPSEYDYIHGCGQLFRANYFTASCLSSTGAYDTMDIMLDYVQSYFIYDENNFTFSSLYDYVIMGTPEDDRLDLSEFSLDFVVYGGSGDDTLITGSGDDVVEGNGGDDIIKLGNGEDIAYGDNYARTYGTPGDDTIYASYYPAGGGCVVGTGCTNGVCKRLYGQEGDDTIYFSCNAAYIDTGSCIIPGVTIGGTELVTYFGYSGYTPSGTLTITAYETSTAYYCNVTVLGTLNGVNDIDISDAYNVDVQGGNYTDYINIEDTLADITVVGGYGDDIITIDGTEENIRIDVAGEEGEDIITLTNINPNYNYQSVINGGMSNGNPTVDPDTQEYEQDDVDCGCVYSWCGSNALPDPNDYFGEYDNCMEKGLDWICNPAPQCYM